MRRWGVMLGCALAAVVAAADTWVIDGRAAGGTATDIGGLTTSETDAGLVLHPNGAGGTAWGADAQGGGGVSSNALTLTTNKLSVTVGPGADYATMNAALAYLSRFQPVYAPGGLTASIVLQPGYTNNGDQVVVEGSDLGWISIDRAGSVESEVPVLATGLTYSVVLGWAGEVNCTPVFHVRNGRLPVINARFVLVGATSYAVGLLAEYGAEATVGMDAGFGGMSVGITAFSTSRISADNTVVTNCADVGISAWDASVIQAVGSRTEGCGIGVKSLFGSVIDCDGNSGGALQYDVVVETGGIVAAGYAGGGLVFSQLVNTLTANGIIFGN